MVRIRQERKSNILRCHVLNLKISGKKTFSKFWHFLLMWALFKCYFWIPHLRIMPGTNFHENITSQTKIINVNVSLRHSKMASFRKNKGILVQICNIHTSVTIQFTRLKFGNSPYLTVWTFMPNYMVFWKHGFRAPIIWCGISLSANYFTLKVLFLVI